MVLSNIAESTNPLLADNELKGAEKIGVQQMDHTDK
jgi:hypothetical protein